MRKIFLIAAIVSSAVANSQVTKVSLQASGLTCSLCSNAINKALKSLNFVDNIESDIKTSTFEITFKDGNKVDFDKLKKKVEGAGFSVAGFIVTMHFNNVKIKSNEAVTVGDKILQFVNINEQTLNGSKMIKVIDKGFVSSKEYKKNPVAFGNGVKFYHVTI